MDETARKRMQIRVVLVVLRGEVTRMNRLGLSGDARATISESLRSRSLQLLDATRADATRAKVKGRAAWHPELIGEIEHARAEVIALS